MSPKGPQSRNGKRYQNGNRPMTLTGIKEIFVQTIENTN